ncbi:MAG: 50S ribosomal protein L4 [bacterium]
MIKELSVFQVKESLVPVDKVTLEFKREPSLGHLHLHLVRQWSNRRLGTVSTKRRGEVRGGGKKPWPQKHTGRARHGSIRSPIWRKGGVVFGPKPRDWSIKMNKKERKLALYSLIYTKVEDFVILEKFNFENPKTKEVELLLGKIEEKFGELKKVVFLYSEKDHDVLKLIKSARNHKKVRKILKANNINVEDLLSADKIIMDKKSIDTLKELFVDFINKGVKEDETAKVKA